MLCLRDLGRYQLQKIKKGKKRKRRELAIHLGASWARSEEKEGGKGGGKKALIRR